jgi:hypothetical protein
MNWFIPREKWSIPKDLFPEEMFEINKMMRDNIKNPANYDGKIIELGSPTRHFQLQNC